ncbi:jacalin-like lectin [Actinocorallia populi]|uniref:jacalin-like lectin n=1 Tax=Actinocorallia populi TaxID=2079200 RepID=UPI000D091863|nr:endonuclease [Actinocorallia populi]
MGTKSRCLVALAVSALLSVAAPGPALPARADPGGAFTVLTYNVAGLPEILSSAPTDRRTATTAIGERLGPYDIVHVQEDFNYHAYLYAADGHPHRTPTSGGAGLGSGLNTLSGLPYDTGDFERVTWDDCSLGSGDCLTPKGFTFMRVRLAEGVHVDLYNLHADAGSGPGDLKARAANLAQLTSFIRSRSAGRAVVVMGDTNTRYTRAGDTIAEFAAANGLADPWVDLVRGGEAPAKGDPALVCDKAAPTAACEVVDKVLYRGDKQISLTATSYGNDHAAFLTGDGLMLSDHHPISAGLTWRQSPGFRLSDPFGGPHGGHYSDLPSVKAGSRVAVLSLRAGSRVDRVGATLEDGTVLSHGGTGGTLRTLALDRGEYAVSAKLCRGRKHGRTRIFHVEFTTDRGRTLSGGTVTPDCVSHTAPPGWQIAGYHGRSGTEVNKLGMIYTRR